MQSALWIYGGQFGGVSRTHHAIRSSAGHKDKTASYNGFYCPTALSDTVHLPPPPLVPRGRGGKESAYCRCCAHTHKHHPLMQIHSQPSEQTHFSGTSKKNVISLLSSSFFPSTCRLKLLLTSPDTGLNTQLNHIFLPS